MPLPKTHLLPPLIAAVATGMLGTLAAFVFMGMDAQLWNGLDLANAALDNEYCEHNRMADFIRQPMNSWSNLCYFFLGTWTMAWAVMDHRVPTDQPSQFSAPNPQRRFPALTLWISLMLMGLCFGSFFFHASLTRVGQHWDMTFTYALSLGLVVMAGHRLAVGLGMKENAAIRSGWLLLAMALAVVVYLIKWHLNGKIVLPLMILTGVGLLLAVYIRERKKFKGWFLLAGLLSIILASIFRTVDVAKTGCEPAGWMQLHALWHVCTGLAAFFFLIFLRSEKA
jgi:hypothetical protein